MGQHVIGHGRYRETYPQTPHVASALLAFARNNAVGPTTTTPVAAAGTQVPWTSVAVGAPGVNVPVTPKSTGIFLITATVTLGNPDGPAAVAQVQAEVNNAVISNTQATVDATGNESVSVTAVTAALPIGVTANIQILVTAPGTTDGQIVIVQASSNINVQEIQTATG